ncbi:MAG: biopolymer transporter ExbD [Bacteroidales bacterium]|jgi:biopolymer transport protein ExbD|nr:biopolymer transporter ExbD [Bacteroidales bacterium]
MARKKKSVPALNSSSMSDISFLLLTFFLLTSSINTDKGIPRRLPPMNDKPKENTIKIHENNIFQVLVDKNDRLFFDGAVGDIALLKDRAKEFLSNPQNLPNLPDKKQVNIPLLGEVMVSQGVISLQNDRGTSYDIYVQVQNELEAAIKELRDEMAKNKFYRSYSDCTHEQQEAVDKAVPSTISEAEPVGVKEGGKK